MREEGLIKIVRAIYIEMYKKATPPADFEELEKKYAGTDYQVWRDHVLSMDEQDEIIKKYTANKGLTKQEKIKIRNTVLLGCSPINK